MSNNDWKETLVRKLTSRKFWAAVVGFVSSVMIAAGAPSGSIERVTAIITSAGTLIAYMISEGNADAGNAVQGQISAPVEVVEAIGFEADGEESGNDGG